MLWGLSDESDRDKDGRGRDGERHTETPVGRVSRLGLLTGHITYQMQERPAPASKVLVLPPPCYPTQVVTTTLILVNDYVHKPESICFLVGKSVICY